MTAALPRDFGGHRVMLVDLRGPDRRGAIGSEGARGATEAVDRAVRLGIPVVTVFDTSGADIVEGVAALHGWGLLARALGRASGCVPVVAVVTGACVSGPALLLGLADHVVMTPDAFAYLSGPAAVAEITGRRVDHAGLGGAELHRSSTGVASLVVEPESVPDAVGAILDHLPPNHLADPPPGPTVDPPDRPCRTAAGTVPARSEAAYDVRDVISDIVDDGDFLEVRGGFAPNLVTGYGHLAGRVVGIVANQPSHRAGTLDIAASQKGARFVAHLDSFNVPIVTLVDTPGFEPGRDLEWRGMIRHGAQLVHAYAAATVPRLCVVLRKAYGGAYIVMDSRGVGNDLCIAWPSAEIAVMGAAGAVAVLHGRRLSGLEGSRRDAERERLEAEYAERFSGPYEAAERGLVDAVIDPADTRRALAAALAAIVAKRELPTARRHANSPL